MQFLKNIEEIRARARQQIASGAVTKDYKLDRQQAISIKYLHKNIFISYP